MGNPKNLEGMKRFGIRFEKAFGVSMPQLRKFAKQYKNQHSLSLLLWESEYHEAKIFATLIENPKETTEPQIDKWVDNLYSWDICDQLCSNLLEKLPFIEKKCLEYTFSDKEFVKRAGFVSMARFGISKAKLSDSFFDIFFERIEQEATDERVFVKKAINWALRQIGKRNMNLREKAIFISEKLLLQNSRSAKWIANDAIRELKNEKIIEMIKKREK